MIAAVLVALAMTGGVMLIVSGWKPRPPAPHPRRIAAPDIARLRALLVSCGCAAAAGLVILAITGQPVLGVAAGLAGWTVVSHTRHRRAPSDADLAEAIALWTETLRNGVSAADGIETLLVSSARHAPPLIRPDVDRLAARLPYAPLEVVLDDRTGTLNHPVADLVARALGQAAAEGASLQPVLDRLAKRARGLAEMHRRIDVARQQPRTTLRTVTAIIVSFTVLLFVVARDWMSAYRSLAGQVLLVLLLAWGTLWWAVMARMARVQAVPRYYAKTTKSGAERGAPS